MSGRRRLDLYETGEAAIEALLSRISIGKIVCEPCVGRGAISRPLQLRGHVVLTNDIDKQHEAVSHQDAAELRLDPRADIITNPPFSEAHRIVPWFVDRGHRCAFLLRLSWLEPTLAKRARQPFLVRKPPDGLIVLPRYSFTGDGRTDSVTCAWMLWGFELKPAIEIQAKAG